jgi:hypothetical protein
MDPRCAPQEILPAHPNDKVTDVTIDPWASTSPVAPGAGCPNGPQALTAPTQHRCGLDDHQIPPPIHPPARQQNPEQAVSGTEIGTTGTCSLQHSKLMTQDDQFQDKLATAAKTRPQGRNPSSDPSGHEFEASQERLNRQVSLVDKVLRTDRWPTLSSIGTLRRVKSNGDGRRPR